MCRPAQANTTSCVLLFRQNPVIGPVLPGFLPKLINKLVKQINEQAPEQATNEIKVGTPKIIVL